MPIDQFAADVVGAAKVNDIDPAALLAVVEVESSGRPFEADNRTPRFLFERHVFFRELRQRAADKLGAAVTQGLAHDGWRPKSQYQDQRSSAAKLSLLARARGIDVECANRSCSWGLGQTMGFNAEALGFSDAGAMLAFLDAGGVRAQIDLMVRFIKTNNLLEALNRRDWDAFARRYNGKRYKENRYDTKLAEAYARWARSEPATAPDVRRPVPAPAPPAGVVAGLAEGEEVRKLQAALEARGFSPGPIDGVHGPATSAALAAFQRAARLPETGIADGATRAALGLAARPATASDLRPDVFLRNLFEILIGRARQSLGASPGGTRAEQPPVLSPIDKLLGGEALVGKKTGLAVVAYVVLVLLQIGGVVGAATPTGQILSAVIAAFGGLGGLAKIDRLVQVLGAIAAKPHA